MVVAPTRRRSADERREEILGIAIEHFAIGGYRGAYTDELLPDRHAVLMMMQGFAAAGADPDIRAHVRETFRDMAMEVAVLGGVAAGDVWAFFANGMLLNIMAALGLQEMAVLAP